MISISQNPMNYFPPTIKERLVDHVRANPRQVTRVVDLAKALGSPHPSVREALYRAAKEGLIRIVESRTGRGGGVVLEVV